MRNYRDGRNSDRLTSTSSSTLLVVTQHDASRNGVVKFEEFADGFQFQGPSIRRPNTFL